MMLSVLNGQPAAVAPSITGLTTRCEVFANGVQLDNVTVPSVTRALNTDQTATVNVNLWSSGVTELFSDGAPAKGPDSPVWEIFADLPTGRIRIFEGFTNLFEFHPGSGWMQFSLVGCTGHKGILSEQITNLAPPFGDWQNIGAHVTATDSVSSGSGISVASLLGGTQYPPTALFPFGVIFPDGVYVSCDLGEQAKPYDVNVTSWARRDSSKAGFGQVRIALENQVTHNATSRGIDLSQVGPDQWVRLSPDATPVPANKSYTLHLAVLAPYKGLGVADYSDFQVRIDQLVGVGPGFTSADLAAVMWQEQFFATNQPWAVALEGESETVYVEGQWFPTRERSDPRSNIPSDAEFCPDPDGRRILVAGIGGIGGLHSNLLAGFPTGEFRTSDVQSGTDGMASRVFEMGPWGDACNEEAVAERSSVHPWSMTETAQVGVLPIDLAGLAAGTLSVVGRGKSVEYTNTAVTPIDGQCPIDWWGYLTPGDSIPNRVSDGPIEMGDVQRITGLEADFTTGSLKVTVASEAA